MEQKKVKPSYTKDSSYINQRLVITLSVIHIPVRVLQKLQVFSVIAS